MTVKIWIHSGREKDMLQSYHITTFLCFTLQLGKSKVFLRAGQIAVLDSRRAEVLDNSAKIIQCHLRMFLVRRDFLRIKRASFVLQAFCRGMTCGLCCVNPVFFLSWKHTKFSINLLYKVSLLVLLCDEPSLPLLVASPLYCNYGVDFCGCKFDS